MKSNISLVGAHAHTCFFVTILFMVFMVGDSLPASLRHFRFQEEGTKVGPRGYKRHQEGSKEELGMELYPTGSSIPDCSHACGPCFPCKRVMVSFKCSMTESCPIVYRCMCKGKYYHVPSN